MKSRRHFLQAAGALTAGSLLAQQANALNKTISLVGRTVSAGNLRQVTIAHTGLPSVPGNLPAYHLLIAPNALSSAPAVTPGSMQTTMHQHGLIKTGVVSSAAPLLVNGLPDAAFISAFCDKAVQLKAAGCQVVAAYLNLPLPGRKDAVQLSHWTGALHSLDVLFTAPADGNHRAATVIDRNRHELLLLPLHNAKEPAGSLHFWFDDNLFKNKIDTSW